MKSSNEIMIDGPGHAGHAECELLLLSLTDWFGAEARERYPLEAEVLPTFTARLEGNLVGFLTVKRHFPATAEIRFLAVQKDHHRRGVGKRLMAAAEEWLRREGVQFLSVKTLSESSGHALYAGTRQFYLDQGLVPFEEMPRFWNEANPCLLMVKCLGSPHRTPPQASGSDAR